MKVVCALPGHGNLEQELRKEGIPYYVVQRFSAWTYPVGIEKSLLKRIKWVAKRILNLFAILRHVYIIKKEKIDIVHVNVMTDYISAAAATLAGCKFVWHVREHLVEDLNRDFFSWNCSRQLIQKADCMIAISKSVASKWKEEGLPPVKVIYDAVPIENYCISPREKELDSEGVHVLMFGRIYPQKGQLLLVKALAKIFGRGEHRIRVSIAGYIEDRTYYDEIMGFIAANGLRDRVQYVGEILDVEELRRMMGTVEVVVVCSYMEGFGRVTVEGMLSCSLVIGSDSGATSELIVDGRTGLLYRRDDTDSLAEKLAYVVTHREECRQMAVEGQRYAKGHFSVERNCREVMGVYEECVKKRSDRGEGDI